MDPSREYSTNILHLKLMAAFNSPCWTLAKHSMIPWGNFDRINVSRCPGFSSQHLLVHHKTSVGSTHKSSWISFYLAILCHLYGMMIRDPFKKVVNETSNDRGSSWVTNWSSFCKAELRPSFRHTNFLYRGFLKWWYPTTMGFPTKNDHFGVFAGCHHLRKHPYLFWKMWEELDPPIKIRVEMQMGSNVFPWRLSLNRVE